ncbi:MAG: Acetylornithine deacetylase/Succinyl-diaminopimelate desuccinylase and related deacylases, partial [uncultured Thermomicrobiales bacterium]
GRHPGLHRRAAGPLYRHAPARVPAAEHLHTRGRYRGDGRTLPRDAGRRRRDGSDRPGRGRQPGRLRADRRPRRAGAEPVQPLRYPAPRAPRPLGVRSLRGRGQGRADLGARRRRQQRPPGGAHLRRRRLAEGAWRGAVDAALHSGGRGGDRQPQPRALRRRAPRGGRAGRWVHLGGGRHRLQRPHPPLLRPQGDLLCRTLGAGRQHRSPFESRHDRAEPGLAFDLGAGLAEGTGRADRRRRLLRPRPGADAGGRARAGGDAVRRGCVPPHLRARPFPARPAGATVADQGSLRAYLHRLRDRERLQRTGAQDGPAQRRGRQGGHAPRARPGPARDLPAGARPPRPARLRRCRAPAPRRRAPGEDRSQCAPCRGSAGRGAPAPRPRGGDRADHAGQRADVCPLPGARDPGGLQPRRRAPRRADPRAEREHDRRGLRQSNQGDGAPLRRVRAGV